MFDDDENASLKEAEDRWRREAEAFFWLVGYAIAEWAHVDRALYDLCKWTLNAGDEKTAAIFYKSTSISDHLGLVDKLMKLSVNQKRMADWIEIKERTAKLLPFRNDIAHNPATQVSELHVTFLGYETTEEEPKPTTRKPPLRPSTNWWELRTEPKKLLKKHRSTVTKSGDLKRHITDVRQLLRDYWLLSSSLPKRPLKRPPKPTEPKAPRAAGSRGKCSRIPPRHPSPRKPSRA